MFDLLATVDYSSFANTFIANAWDWETLFQNGESTAKTVGGALLSALGIIVLVVAGIYLAMVGLSKRSKGQYVWQAVIGIIIGGVLTAGGVSLLTQVSQGSYKSVKELGE